MGLTARVGLLLKMLLLCCVSFCFFAVFAGYGSCRTSFDVRRWGTMIISEFIYRSAQPSRVTSRRLDIEETAAVPSQVERTGRKRRILLGPGSYPPRCAHKCSECTPCRPVHVPLPPPGTPVTAEYYPEAWRCKCGSRLYMP